MTVPVYQIEVAWSGRLTGVFTIGTSTIGGTDVIAGVFGSNSFDDITADVMDFRCTRGRANDMATMQQGRCSIRLRDMNGKYNPENTNSSLNGYLLPMRPLRIRATYSGTTYGLFYGYISRIQHDPEARESLIEAVDFFEWLQNAKPTVTEKTNWDVDNLIGAILDAVGFTDPNLRSLSDSASVVPTYSLAGGTAALSAIEILLRVDRGIFFIDGNGKAIYKDRNSGYANGAAATDFTGLLARVKTATEKDSIINGQTCTKTGNTDQTATNTTSRQDYGYRDGSAITSAYFDADATALSCARFIVAMNKDPRPPARLVHIQSGDDARLTQQLTRELSDLVTVGESVGGTSFKGRIEALEHIGRRGSLHETRYVIQKVSVAGFTIGTSTIGGADIIGY